MNSKARKGLSVAPVALADETLLKENRHVAETQHVLTQLRDASPLQAPAATVGECVAATYRQLGESSAGVALQVIHIKAVALCIALALVALVLVQPGHPRAPKFDCVALINPRHQLGQTSHAHEETRRGGDVASVLASVERTSLAVGEPERSLMVVRSPPVALVALAVRLPGQLLVVAVIARADPARAHRVLAHLHALRDARVAAPEGHPVGTAGRVALLRAQGTNRFGCVAQSDKDIVTRRVRALVAAQVALNQLCRRANATLLRVAAHENVGIVQAIHVASDTARLNAKLICRNRNRVRGKVQKCTQTTHRLQRNTWSPRSHI